MKKLSIVIDLIERINTCLALIAGGVIFTIFTVVTYEVIMRYFLVRPTTWAMDTAEMMMILLLYLPAASILSKGWHVRMDLVINRVHGQLRTILEIMSSLAILCFSILIVWQGCRAFYYSYQVGMISMMAELPFAPFLFFVPLGGAFLALQSMINISRASRRSEESEGIG